VRRSFPDSERAPISRVSSFCRRLRADEVMQPRGRRFRPHSKPECRTRRQSQRPGLSCLLQSQESRQSLPWLIFDVGQSMKRFSRPRIAGPIESGLIFAFALWMPVLWWSPKTWVTIAAVPTWLVLWLLARVMRKRNAERRSTLPYLALEMSLYLCYACLAFYVRK
jgi:hypothetical protein